jgi:hypothetical protein
MAWNTLFKVIVASDSEDGNFDPGTDGPSILSKDVEQHSSEWRHFGIENFDFHRIAMMITKHKSWVAREKAERD